MELEWYCNKHIVVLIELRARWRSAATCKRDFVIAIAHMHADHDGDA